MLTLISYYAGSIPSIVASTSLLIFSCGVVIFIVKGVQTISAKGPGGISLEMERLKNIESAVTNVGIAGDGAKAEEPKLIQQVRDLTVNMSTLQSTVEFNTGKLTDTATRTATIEHDVLVHRGWELEVFSLFAGKLDVALPAYPLPTPNGDLPHGTSHGPSDDATL